MGKSGRKVIEPEIRFWKFVNKTLDCWEWTGATNGKYGLFFPGGDRLGGNVYAHRWSYGHFVADIPEGLEINHKCENKLCVRYEHLEAVTKRQNLTYGNHPDAVKSRQTHCKRDHEFNEANTYIKPNGTRSCRVCHKLNERARRASITSLVWFQECTATTSSPNASGTLPFRTCI